MKQIITDANRVLFECEAFEAPTTVYGATRLVAADKSYNGFLGFGVALTGSSCYLLAQMEERERTALLKSLYAAGGMRVARLSIGSSDYSAELYTYSDRRGHFSVERDEKYIIPMIKEVLKINPDIFIFASPWSPPGWMKTGGNICGGYMRAEFICDYADYFADYIKAYAERGIKISAVTLQNEPGTAQSGKMPACVWHPEIEAEFIKVLYKKFKENNLDVKIWMHDHNFEDVIPRVKWLLDNKEGLADCVDSVAFHYYSGRVEQTREFSAAYPDIDLQFTEGGPRLYDNYGSDHCKWSTMIIKSLVHGIKSFTGWNLMLDETGNPNIGPFGCGGFVTRDSVTHELSYSGQYNAYRHFMPYITADSSVTELAVSNDFGQRLSDYPEITAAPVGIAVDDKVAMIVNNNSQKTQLQFTLGGKQYYAELPPDSVSTFII